MTTALHEGFVPEFDLGDRLRKARETTGLGAPAFAKEIGVSHKTVNNAESGRHAVRKIVINAYSLATGVSVEWLETGNAPTGYGGGDNTGADDETRTRNILLGSAKVLRPPFPARAA